MNILVTLDSNYILPLKVMLWSLFFNNPGHSFNIYLMHSSISSEELEGIYEFTERLNQRLHVITLDEDLFEDAPVILHYTREMYYRLLAYKCLPEDLERVLYLDPDILIINSIRELYHMDMSNAMFAAACHNRRIPLKEINRLRLKVQEMEGYFNSGVLLMNLPLQREKIKEEDIFEFVEKKKNRLIFPDQDVLNALYYREIKKIDEIKYNYDVRFYQYNKILSNGLFDMDYVMRHTAILHFCGRKKPWHKNYNGKFLSLYKHYQILALERSDKTLRHLAGNNPAK